MVLDIQSHKKKISQQKPTFNMVPFIDILFTILIFLVLTSNFSATDVSDMADSDSTGKPNVTDTSGSAEYYIMPVANLNKVTVNGQDMSSLIRDNAIGVQAQVIDKGQIVIKPGEIIITTPPGVSPEVAVRSPN
ncbi:biopolymer transporter ExbD [Methanobrevibacter sp. OttesenSCG-928-K11]|nr:biopolymer transporter ExbD [Methanobrevibacter sp. OttesenSCG-928-K11]